MPTCLVQAQVNKLIVPLLWLEIKGHPSAKKPSQRRKAESKATWERAMWTDSEAVTVGDTVHLSPNIIGVQNKYNKTYKAS